MLEHSESAVVFVGKLDDWPAMAPGVPEGIPTVAMPLHPEGRFDRQWSDLQACAPLEGDTPTAAEQLATLIYTSGTTGVPRGDAQLQQFRLRRQPRRGTVRHPRRRPDALLPAAVPRGGADVRRDGVALRGTTVFFAESLDTFVEDMKRARPTLLFGVPRIWTKFQMGCIRRCRRRSSTAC